MGVSKFPKLGFLRLWGPIILSTDLRSRWGIKQCCRPCRGLSNGMLHVTYTQGNWGDFWFLVVRSQIANLTLGLSFDHNLCFRCSNGWWELILDIYVPRVFQWYKERFNSLIFDPCNYPLKIWESIGTRTPKMEVHLGVWGFIPSLFCIFRSMKCDSWAHFWLAPLQALALVTSPRLGMRHLSKPKISIMNHCWLPSFLTSMCV